MSQLGGWGAVATTVIQGCIFVGGVGGGGAGVRHGRGNSLFLLGCCPPEILRVTLTETLMYIIMHIMPGPLLF